MPLQNKTLVKTCLVSPGGISCLLSIVLRLDLACGARAVQHNRALDCLALEGSTAVYKEALRGLKQGKRTSAAFVERNEGLLHMSRKKSVVE